MRGLDCFVLPSLAEGISNTILEAMASGLPVIATDVGGNADLGFKSGVTGRDRSSGRLSNAMAQQIVRYLRQSRSGTPKLYGNLCRARKRRRNSA